MVKYFAHTQGEDERDWQPLADHLAGAAERASGFGKGFGAVLCANNYLLNLTILGGTL